MAKVLRLAQDVQAQAQTIFKRRKKLMAKVLRCRDVGMDCDFVAQAETEEEILQLAAAHARMVHNMREIPAEVITAVRAAVREIQSSHDSL